jgi:hypothetical protein
MAQPGRLDDNSPLGVENVLIAKQIDPARPPCELAIEERVIIRAPADLGNIKSPGMRSSEHTRSSSARSTARCSSCKRI